MASMRQGRPLWRACGRGDRCGEHAAGDTEEVLLIGPPGTNQVFIAGEQIHHVLFIRIVAGERQFAG